MKISEAELISNKLLQSLGFYEDDSALITKNLIEAELSGKKTHGLIRLSAIKRQVDSKKLNTDGRQETIIKETETVLHIDGNYKPAFIVIYRSLEKAFEKVKRSGVLIVGLKDLGYASGYIGAYAREATERNLIFIGFHNSPGGLIPHGTTKDLWGTNPVTVGIPTNDLPVILDMASSKITWGDLLIAKSNNSQLEEHIALDVDGNPTTDPNKAVDGGLLPIAGHKGSGLAFIIELLAGALTGSMVGSAVEGGWGSLYILIDPSVFRPLDEFKNDIQKAIEKLKESPKAEGVEEIYFAGEQSAKLRKKNLEKGSFEVSDALWEDLNI